MIPSTLVENLRRVLRKFRAATSGNVAITFALSLLPIVGLVGAAVDYSRGNSARTAMQQAIDATGLMLSREAASADPAQLSLKANAYFKALLNRIEITDVVVTSTLENPAPSSYKLMVVATGNIATSFTKILGMEKLDLRVDTEVVWGVKKLELALALDNTGSMSTSNKMIELKKAAKSLLDTLKIAAKQAGDIRVSVIPFDTAVRIGASYKNETWIDWTEAFGNCSKTLSHPRTKTRCTTVAGGTWTPISDHNTWNGCVIDRGQNHDTLDTTPDVAVLATQFPATSDSGCSGLAGALPLTDIWDTGHTTLTNKIDAMQPNGYTNVTIGLAWAWHSLTPNLPYTQALAPDPNLDKVMILLTDGDNTRNRWTTNQASIDARTQTACTNVKAANIKLYTIRVIEGNATLLKNCATNPSMYYDVQSASQLNSVFTEIANALANRRIAK